MIRAGVIRQKLEHKVKFFEEGRSFGRSDPVMPGITDRHFYWVNQTDDGKTLFVQADRVKGPHGHLGYNIGHQMAQGMMQVYVEFNHRLKARVESI